LTATLRTRPADEGSSTLVHATSSATGRHATLVTAPT
jgi:hypothetical protein